MARIAKAEIVTLCQLRPEELEELMNISKVGEDEMQQILRRKHRERISVGDADEDVESELKGIEPVRSLLFFGLDSSRTSC